MSKHGSGIESRRAKESGVRRQMQSEERRIVSQHERLDELCREVYAKIDKYGAEPATPDYLLFVTALDAHMTVEEDIYFPALYGLRADTGSEFAELVAEHEEMRLDADQIRDLLKSGDATAARLALDRLARRISHHEAAEEQLISRISEGPVADFGHSILE